MNERTTDLWRELWAEAVKEATSLDAESVFCGVEVGNGTILAMDAALTAATSRAEAAERSLAEAREQGQITDRRLAEVVFALMEALPDAPVAERPVGWVKRLVAQLAEARESASVAQALVRAWQEAVEVDPACPKCHGAGGEWCGLGSTCEAWWPCDCWGLKKRALAELTTRSGQLVDAQIVADDCLSERDSCRRQLAEARAKLGEGGT